MAATILSTLKMIPYSGKPKGQQSNVSPTQKRRDKIIAALEQQVAMARAEADGEEYKVTKQVTTKDADGKKTKTPKDVRVAKWYWPMDDGKTYEVVVKYGVKTLALGSKGGLRSFEASNLKAVPKVFEQLVLAVRQGELDNILASAAIRQVGNKK